MSTLNVNIPATFEETITAPHITGLETPTQPTDAANKQYADYMRNVFQFANMYDFGQLDVIFYYPRFEGWSDYSPSRFLGGAIMGRITCTGGSGTYDITDTFTNNGFFVRSNPTSTDIKRTQNFYGITNSGQQNYYCYFTIGTNSISVTFNTTIPNGVAFQFCFIPPFGCEIGYND